MTWDLKTQYSHSVGKAGGGGGAEGTKMASTEFWIPGRHAHTLIGMWHNKIFVTWFTKLRLRTEVHEYDLSIN